MTAFTSAHSELRIFTNTVNVISSIVAVSRCHSRAPLVFNFGINASLITDWIRRILR